jgi:hypothetical protein
VATTVTTAASAIAPPRGSARRKVETIDGDCIVGHVEERCEATLLHRIATDVNRCRSLAGLVAVAIVTFVAALPAVGARATYGARVTADEPQYLLTALSIGEDLDLDISDELDTERFRTFHEVGLNTQTIDLDEDGQRISPHDPLLPIVLALPMRLGGWRAAKVALAALAALTAAATAWTAHARYAVGRRAALLVTAGFFCAPPLTGYATQVYPEMPAALAVSLGADRRRSAGGGGTDRRRPVAIGGVLIVAGAAYLIVHQRVYGGWTVYAAGDHFVDGELLVVGDNPNYPGRSRRLIGLLIDRQFGLIPWAPAYLLLVPAVVAAARRRASGHRLLLPVLGTGWAVATWIALTMHGWWSPGRQVVVVLPAAVVLIAQLVDSHRRLQAAAVAGSVVGALSWLWLVFEASTGRRTLVVDFFETANPWYRAWSPLFPDHQRIEPVDWALTGAWSLLAGTAAYLTWRAVAGRPAVGDGDGDGDAGNDDGGGASVTGGVA